MRAGKVKVGGGNKSVVKANRCRINRTREREREREGKGKGEREQNKSHSLGVCFEFKCQRSSVGHTRMPPIN
jgi:hypothetical protein